MSVKPYEKPKGSGIWYIRISHEGKRRSKKIGARDVAEEIAKQLEAKMVLGQLGILEEKPKAPTFGEIATNWLHDYIKQAKAPGTYERYLCVYRQRIAPSLGKRPIAEIRRSEIRNLLLAISKDLSSSSVCVAQNVCSGIFHYALDDELLDKNPMIGISKQLGLNKKSANRFICFQPAEIEAFLSQAADSHPKQYLFFFLAFRTGLRLGEICGLQWGDINYVQRSIHVQRAYKNTSIRDLKTARSDRDVDMTEQLVEALREHHTTEKERWLKNGATAISDKHVFTMTAGTPYKHVTALRIFKRILELAGLSSRRIHDIRHTFASVLLTSGASPQYVSRQMGHASISITVDIYGHLIPGSNKGAIEILDSPSSLLDNSRDKMQL